MFKLDLEKAEEPEIKLPTSVGSSKKQESSRKTSTSALLTMPKPLTLWITKSVGNSLRYENTRPPFLPSEKSVWRSRSNSQNRTWDNRLVPNQERSTLRLYIFTSLFNLYTEYIMWNGGLDESQAGIKIAWRSNNFSYADNITLMAESEEPLEGERGEWKSWLTTQHSNN